jgi:hypothetical protein
MLWTVAPPTVFPVLSSFRTNVNRIKGQELSRSTQVTEVNWSIGYFPIVDKIPRLFRSMLLVITNIPC